jgi:hypothetical protein
VQKLEAHEIATLFPTMSDVDLAHLRESIERQGQLEDVLLFEGKILDGRHRYEACVELGREPRVREFQGSAQDAFVHSVALNLSRRHLTTVQRAAAGAGIKAFQSRLLSASDAMKVALAEATATAKAEAKAEKEEAKAAKTKGAAESAPEADDPASSRKRKRSDTTPAAEGDEPGKSGKRPRTVESKARAIASQRVGVSGRVIDAAEKIKHDAPDVFERMLAGTAGSLPDAKRVTALPQEARERVHALVDEGKKLKAAIREVAPAPPPVEGTLFLGKIVLEADQAQAFEGILEARGIKRADAAREALLDWIAKYAVAEAK